MRAMILAAGLGNRMLPLTSRLPKPLLRVGGYSLIEHQVFRLARAGVRHIVVNHFYLGEMIEAQLGDGSHFGVSIRYSRESVRLETAGGIIAALPLLEDECFIVANADIWSDFDYSRLAAVDGRQTLAHLVLVPNAPHHPHGDFLLGGNGRLVNDSPDPMARLTFSGISVMHRSMFAGLSAEPRPLLPVLQAAIKDDRVSGEIHPGLWIDIGTPERLAQLQQLEAGRYKPSQSG